MEHMILSTEQLASFVRINQATLKESWKPYEPDARQKYLLEYLGEQLHDELMKLANNQQEFPSWADTQEKKDIASKILYLCQNALSKFTLHIATPHLDLQLTEQGFIVFSGGEFSPASSDRVKKAADAFLSLGYDNIETLLRYLEKHHQVITSYKESDAFVLATNNFINSASVFDRIVSIDSSRLQFIKMRPMMDNVENTEITGIISHELSEQIKDQMRKSVITAPNKTLLDIIQRALAHLTMAEVMDSSSDERKRERLYLYGKNYIARIKQLLDKNPDDYPLYKTSEQFTEKHEYKHFDYNDDESSFFVAGSPNI